MASTMSPFADLSSDIDLASDQDKKFTKILTILGLIYIVFAVVIPFIEQADVPREIKEKVPVQLAKIMLKEKQLPLPEKAKEKPVEKEKPEKEEVEKAQTKEVKVAPVKSKREIAKDTAKNSGLAAMKDELFAIRDAFDANNISSKPLTNQQTSEQKVQRKLLASESATKSQSLSALTTSNTVVSDELSSHDYQQVNLSDKEVLANTDINKVSELSSSSSSSRSEVAIRQTLEAKKARLYSRYNRALRKDPFLKGKVLFEIEIQPDGKVSNVVIASSELGNEKLEKQLVAIIRSIRFSAQEVEAMVTIWAINFLPG